jgi:DNA-binding transcriptional LysR family regulator
MDVTTDYLRTFIAVCEWKSFSLATARVHKSQAAISTQIAKLEEQAGSKFIDRSQRQFKLTKAGKLFLNFARDVVSRTDAAQSSLAALKNGNSEQVRIGATRSVGIYLLPEVIGSIAKSLPHLKITVMSRARPAIYESLQQGAVDLAVVLAETVPRGFYSVPLRSEPLCLVISPKHPLASKKVILREELQTVPFIYGMKGNGFSDLVDEAFEKRHILRSTESISISDLRARREAARAGVGVTVLPYFIVKEEIRRKTLRVLTIKEVGLPDAKLMIIGAQRHSPHTNVELVKRLLVENLTAGNRRQDSVLYLPDVAALPANKLTARLKFD